MLYTSEIILFIITFIVIILVWYIVKTKNKVLDKFTGKLAIIGSIFVPLSLYLTYKVFKLQLQALYRDSTFKIIDRSWLNINRSLVNYYKECPNFVNSLYFDWQKKVLGKNYEINSVNQDNWYAVNYISISIFQAWEDFLTSEIVDETGDIVWINNFLQWSSSSILRNNWSVLKTNFASTTQEFGDYLFYMSSIYKPKNESELNNLAKMIVDSEKYKNILKLRHKNGNF